MQTGSEPSKNLLKIVRSLDQKKFREEYGLFAVEGEKGVTELLKSGWDVPFVFDATGSFTNKGEQYYAVSAGLLGKMSFQKSPQGVMAVGRIPENNPDCKEFLNQKVLLLDGINDPGNLGTIIRVAAWFAIDSIVLSPGSVDPYNPKVVQASMGALFQIPVLQLEYAQIKEIKTPFVGMEMLGVSLYEADLPTHAVFVMGSESHGISPEIKAMLNTSITIPGSGKMESLNVGVAAGVLCSEIFRKTIA